MKRTKTLIITIFLITLTSQAIHANSMDKIEVVMNEIRERNFSNSKYLSSLDKSSVRYLVKYLDDEDVRVRKWTIKALRNINHESVVTSISTMLQHPVHDTAVTAIEALEKFDVQFLAMHADEINPVLIEYANKLTAKSHIAVNILGLIGDDTLIPEIKNINEEVGRKDTIPKLIKFKVHHSCIQALARFNDEAAIEEIIQNLQSNDTSLISTGIRQIEYVGKPLGVNLIPLLDDVRECDEKYIYRSFKLLVCDMAVNAIESIYKPSLSFEFKKDRHHYTQEEINEVRTWLTIRVKLGSN